MTPTERHISRSEAETEALAARFAARLQPGDTVALYGDLGSGKTRFAKGLAAGLGVRETVTSPTFVVVNEHRDGRLPLFHFDLYRLRNPAELDELGFDEYVYGEGVCILEWADLAADRLPEQRYDVRLSPGEDPNERIITIEQR